MLLEMWKKESALITRVLEIVEKPETYLHEIQQTLIQETGTNVDISTIGSFYTSTITRQKMTLVAKQKSEIQRTEYLHDMQVFHGHPEMLVFVDETGAEETV